MSWFLYACACSVCFRRFIFQVIKKNNNNNNSSASVLNFYNLTILRCILFEKRLCFKPKYIHFVYSYLAHVTFPSCLRRRNKFVFCFFVFSVFLITRSTRTCRCLRKWSFFRSSVFLLGEESIRSEITNPFLDSRRKNTPLIHRKKEITLWQLVITATHTGYENTQIILVVYWFVQCTDVSSAVK